MISLTQPSQPSPKGQGGGLPIGPGFGGPGAIASAAAGVATFLFVTAVIVNFTVSAMALTRAGLGYDSLDGAAWQKFHPSTYLAVLAIAVNVAARPRPVAWLADRFARFPGATYFIPMWLLLTAYGVLVQKMPLTSLIEPYVLALVALFMIDDLGAPWFDFLRRFIHGVLLANAAIGIVEFATQSRLLPYVISGVPVIGDARSTALLGHPLANAATTGAYLLCLVLNRDLRLAPVRQAGMVAVSILGLIAFGGRTAIVVSGLIIVAKLARGFVFFLLGGRLRLKGVLAAALFTPLVLAGIVGAGYAGVFDALIARFVDDNGSAEARVIALQLFNIFDLNALLLGPNPDLVSSALSSFGISIGVENTWLALMFQYGLIMTAFFVAGLFSLFWEFWRRSRPGVSLLFIYFIVMISSTIGLASKTMIFAQFSLLLLCLFASEGERRPAFPGSGRV